MNEIPGPLWQTSMNAGQCSRLWVSFIPLQRFSPHFLPQGHTSPPADTWIGGDPFDHDDGQTLDAKTPEVW